MDIIITRDILLFLFFNFHHLFLVLLCIHTNILLLFCWFTEKKTLSFFFHPLLFPVDTHQLIYKTFYNDNYFSCLPSHSYWLISNYYHYHLSLLLLSYCYHYFFLFNFWSFIYFVLFLFLFCFDLYINIHRYMYIYTY